MPGISNTNKVGAGSDYDFWKINLPIQERRQKQSSGMPVNILSQTSNSPLGRIGLNTQSVVR